MSEGPARRPRSVRRNNTHCRPTDASASDRRLRPASSAPVALPATHVRRTPSEAQLARENLQAECKDVAMYSLLMTGILRQVERRGDVKHLNPRSRKSIVNIVRTREASDRQLRHPRNDDWDDDERWNVSYYIPRVCDENDEDNNGWEICSCMDEVDQDSSLNSSITSSLLSSQSSRTSLWTLVHDNEIPRSNEGDDCIFSLEM